MKSQSMKSQSMKSQLINIIKHQDCFDFLQEVKSNSIDLILTDPPYIISKETGFKSVVKGVKRFGVSMDFGEWDKNQSNLLPLIEEFYRVLKKGGTCIIFYDIWKISILKNFLDKNNFKQLRLIEWIKDNPVPLNSQINYLTNAKEIAISAVKGSNPVFNSSYDNGLYQYPIYHSKDRFHPTQKPLKLFEDLIKKHTNQQDTVLDCFLGSGTTAIASLNLNRNFIGCELNQTYYNKILNRISLYQNKKPTLKKPTLKKPTLKKPTLKKIQL